MDSLPAEIVALILLELDWKDIVRCQMISKTFSELIQNAVPLQYHIELGISHMIERPRNVISAENTEQQEREAPSSSSITLADKLAELRRAQTAWDLPLLQKNGTKVSCDQFWPAYDLQGGVLSLGVSLGAPRTSQAMRFFKLPTYGESQENLVTWEWKDIGLPVRDFTTDPRMDFIALVEREDIIFPEPPEPYSALPLPPLMIKARHTVHFRTMTSNSPHPKCCSTKTSISFDLDLDANETISTSVLASVRGNLFGFLVRQDFSEFGGGDCILWIWDWVKGERVLMQHKVGSVSFEFLTDDSILMYVAGYGANRADSHEWRIEIHPISYDGVTSPDSPPPDLGIDEEEERMPVIFMLPTLATERLVQIPHIRCRIGPNSTSVSPSSRDLYKGGILEDGGNIWDPKWPFEPNPDDRLVSIVGSLFCDNLPQDEEDFMQGTIVAAFMHSKSLMKLTQESKERFGGFRPLQPALTLSWEEWGPKNVRMVEGLSLNALVCDTNGMRYIRHGELRMDNPPIDDTGYGPVMFIMDFDPYTASSISMKRRLKEIDKRDEDAKNGGETKTIPISRLVDRPTTLKFPNIFQNEIVTELPYRETVLKDPTGLPHTSMILDDERIILFREDDAMLKCDVFPL